MTHHHGYEREKDTPLKLDALLTGTCGSDMVQFYFVVLDWRDEAAVKAHVV